MTIAISLKVNDGVVLAADSAATLMADTPNGPVAEQVFNNANKVFNLRKGLPIGLITWGAGGLGQAGVATLYKDLRMRLTRTDPAYEDYHVDPESYSIRNVAVLARRFIYEETYVPAYEDWKGQKPQMGFIIAGYSANSGFAEQFKIEVNAKGECGAPIEVLPSGLSGMSHNGEPEAILRLLLGFSPRLGDVLHRRLGVPKDQVGPALAVIREELGARVVYPAMPIQDAIDLAEFLVSVTKQYSRYTPGAATVGGPIEIAAVTKHEGFQWIKRKLYFDRQLNPGTNL